MFERVELGLGDFCACHRRGLLVAELDAYDSNGLSALRNFDFVEQVDALDDLCQFVLEHVELPAEYFQFGLREVHVAHVRKTIDLAAAALSESLADPQKVTHLGVGVAKVEKVASNRRILGEDGKVKYVRYSASRVPEAVAAPEGVIDPLVRVISFWNG